MTKIDTSTEAVERLLDGVTPGPWVVDDGGSYCDVVTDYGDGVFGEDFIICEDAHQNAHFIAAARDLVPALLAERDRLMKERDDLRAKMGAAVEALEQLIALLIEASADLTAYADADYPPESCARYPDIARRHHRDLEWVRRINATLAKIKGTDHE